MSSSEALAPLRSNSLAMAFQEAITVVLRVRYRVLRVGDAARFRDEIGKRISKDVEEARRLSYSDASAQMALYAVVGFLDESVLSSHDPAFQDWGRRPLQVELFGGAFCGEYFFHHVNDLLSQPETQECADTLELHALCLMLGFRGKYNLGESGEIASILRRIRDKVAAFEVPVLCAPLSRNSPSPLRPSATRGSRGSCSPPPPSLRSPSSPSWPICCSCPQRSVAYSPRHSTTVLQTTRWRRGCHRSQPALGYRRNGCYFQVNLGYRRNGGYFQVNLGYRRDWSCFQVGLGFSPGI